MLNSLPMTPTTLQHYFTQAKKKKKSYCHPFHVYMHVYTY